MVDSLGLGALVLVPALPASGRAVSPLGVTKQRLPSRSDSSSSSYFELTKYSSTPPASLFSLPTGATTQALPGGTSIP